MANSGKINLYKLKYRIVYCSGEDQEYPVTELLDNSPQSRGWQSPKFCEYPQEIIIQFTNIVKLKQIQFLSHQSKISQKVELYTFVPTGTQALSAQIPLNMIKFTKLGYLSLDSNERSQFQARELKSVYVDAVTLLLKLVFNKCHVNKFNLYNQVGLIALNCMGEMHNALGGTNPGVSVSQSNQNLPQGAIPGQTLTVPNLEEELSIDKNTMETLKALYSAKERAVMNEDFDEAKRLKETIERLKTVAGNISQLEERKKLAIQNEDYDSAKMIKIEIEKLKQAVMYPAFTQPSFPPQYYQSQGPHGLGASMLGVAPPQYEQRSGSPDMYGQQSNYGIPMRNSNSPKLQNDSYLQQNPYEERKVDDQQLLGGEFGRQNRFNEDFHQQRQNEAQEAFSKMHEEGELGMNDFKGSGGGSRSSLQNKKQEEVRQSVQPYDEQVIPTLSKNPQGRGNAETGGDEEHKVEEISPENMKYAEALIPVFGEEPVKKMFSRPWSLREEGLKECEEIIKKNGNDQAVFQAALSAAGQAMGDKIAQIITRGMLVLQTTLNSANTQMEPGSSLTSVFNQLFNRLGDNNSRIREKAEEILVQMAGHKSFGAQTVCQQITKGQVKKSAQFSVKHILGRLQLLFKVLDKFPINQHNIHFNPLLEYALYGFKHQNGDIRTQSYHVILEIYKAIGGKIRSHLTGLRQAQLEMLENGFCEIDGVDPSTRKQTSGQSPPKETIATNINPKGGAPGGSKPNSQQKKGRPGTKSDEVKCQFCSKGDKSFSEQEKLDLHFWKDCAMLTECQHCSQVIEIATYNDHLIRECEKAAEFKQCPRCKESIHMDTYDGHVKDKQCLISKPPKAANRCPLCHQDIKPGENGWKKHLLDEKCPNNPRP